MHRVFPPSSADSGDWAVSTRSPCAVLLFSWLSEFSAITQFTFYKLHTDKQNSSVSLLTWAFAGRHRSRFQAVAPGVCRRLAAARLESKVRLWHLRTAEASAGNPTVSSVKENRAGGKEWRFFRRRIDCQSWENQGDLQDVNELTVDLPSPNLSCPCPKRA